MAMINKQPTRALLLAAGRGRRLRPYTDTTPKPLLPVGGEKTLHFVLASLQSAGVTEVGFVVHHLADQIKAFVGNGRQWEINPTFFEQRRIQGTGDAILAARSFISEPLFILATDYILPVPFLVDLKRYYLRQGTDMAVSLKKVPDGEIRLRSSVRLDAKGGVVQIVEKPAVGEAPSSISASLIYITPPQIVGYVEQTEPSARNEYEMQDAINLMLADGMTLCGLLQEAPPEWHPALARRG